MNSDAPQHRLLPTLLPTLVPTMEQLVAYLIMMNNPNYAKMVAAHATR